MTSITRPLRKTEVVYSECTVKVEQLGESAALLQFVKLSRRARVWVSYSMIKDPDSLKVSSNPEITQKVRISGWFLNKARLSADPTPESE